MPSGYQHTYLFLCAELKYYTVLLIWIIILKTEQKYNLRELTVEGRVGEQRVVIGSPTV